MSRIQFGNRNMQRAIRRYGDNVLDEVKRIVVETAYIIQSNAQALAPVDDGNLRDSIAVELLQGGLKAKVTVGANYAIWIEYGTGIYSSTGQGRDTPWTYYSDKLGRFVTTQGMRPQPFWHEAVDKGRRHFRNGMRALR